MSNSAYVAVPTDSNKPTYNVYHSRNGGRNFKLHKFLTDFEKNSLETLQALPHRLPGGFNDIQKAARELDVKKGNIERIQEDDPIVEPNPIAEGETVEDIINNANYITHDVLYVVKYDHVTTYYLSYYHPTLPSLFAINTQVRILPRSNDQRSHQNQNEPFYIMEGDDFVHPNETTKVRRDAPPLKAATNEWKQAHMGAIRNLYRIHEGQNIDACQVLTDKFNFEIKFKKPVHTDTIVPTQRTGVAIKCALDYGSPIEIWKDTHYRADELRWDHAQDAFSHLAEATAQEKKMERFSRIGEDFITKNKVEFGSARPSIKLSRSIESSQ